MRHDEAGGRPALSRRAVLGAAGAVLAGLGAGGSVLAASANTAGRSRPTAGTTRSASTPTPTPTPTPILPSLGSTPAADVEFHPASSATLQTMVHVPETGEWFTTQSIAGRSALLDAAGLAVGDIVVSRLTAAGALLDSMTLPDAGHGMGLVVRVEAGVRVVTSCWFAPGPSGSTYDVVRLPYLPGTAARATATTVVPGLGYPLDPSLDPSADPSNDTVTLRHQGGGGPEYTRHMWADFAAGDLTHPIGAIATPDSPPTHQGFCSHGDRFFFYTGASSAQPGGDPMLITEYSWTTGAAVVPPLDASGNARLADGSYPGGRAEPEGATILVDASGAASLVVGMTTGVPSSQRTYPTFRYPLAAV